MRPARHRVKTEIRYDVFSKTHHDRHRLKSKIAISISLIRDVLYDDIDILCDEIHARQILKTGTNND